jgi:hypothetical protein
LPRAGAIAQRGLDGLTEGTYADRPGEALRDADAAGTVWHSHEEHRGAPDAKGGGQLEVRCDGRRPPRLGAFSMGLAIEPWNALSERLNGFGIQALVDSEESVVQLPESALLPAQAAAIAAGLAAGWITSRGRCRRTRRTLPVSMNSRLKSGSTREANRAQKGHWKSENSMIATGAAGSPSLAASSIGSGSEGTDASVGPALQTSFTISRHDTIVIAMDATMSSVFGHSTRALFSIFAAPSYT